MKMQEISVDLQISRQFLVLIATTMVGCLGVVLYLNISVGVKIILLIFLTIYGVHVLWRYGLLKDSHSIKQLTQRSNDWYLRSNSGQFKVSLLGESTVSTWVCVLRFANFQNSKKYSCIVFNDSVESDLYRRLLVAVKGSK